MKSVCFRPEAALDSYGELGAFLCMHPSAMTVSGKIMMCSIMKRELLMQRYYGEKDI